MERTRRQIVDRATELFLSQGFDETTMEEIADRSEVGPSTLYRYFPYKDLIIVEPFRDVLEIGGALRDRPPMEPLAESLGAIVIGLPGLGAEDLARLPALRRIINQHSGPRARFWDALAQAQEHLAVVLAERMGSAATTHEVALTAINFFAVLGFALDRWIHADGSTSREAIAQDVLAEVGRAQFVLPTLPRLIAASTSQS